MQRKKWNLGMQHRCVLFEKVGKTFTEYRGIHSTVKPLRKNSNERGRLFFKKKKNRCVFQKSGHFRAALTRNFKKTGKANRFSAGFVQTFPQRSLKNKPKVINNFSFSYLQKIKEIKAVQKQGILRLMNKTVLTE